MPRIKLIAVDLDGTLLHKDKSISGYTRDVLRRLKERGILIVVATGRNANTCIRLLPQIRADAVISSDGCVAEHNGVTVSLTAIPATVANEMLRRGLVHPGLSGFVADVAEGYLAQSALEPDNPLHIDYMNYTWVTDFADGIGRDAYKIGMLCESQSERSLYKIADSLPGIRVSDPGGSRWHEILPQGVNKWTALNALARRLSVNPEEIAAFGDDVNDIEMLTHAGYGVAVGNAKAAVKAASNYICDANDNDGPAKWIKENILTP
jgi:Cof subfamily protein (haloacid dehalogenase superfamily)